MGWMLEAQVLFKTIQYPVESEKTHHANSVLLNENNYQNEADNYILKMIIIRLSYLVSTEESVSTFILSYHDVPE